VADDPLGVIEFSAQQDFVMEFLLDGTTPTSRWVNLWERAADGQTIAILIDVYDERELGFVVEYANELDGGNPFNELATVVQTFPGVEVERTSAGMSVEGENGQTRFRFEADSNGLVTSYLYESPEVVYLMTFYYGDDMETKAPAAFIQDAVFALENSGELYVYGNTQDAFTTWYFSG
jgi:hypothetical protein